MNKAVLDSSALLAFINQEKGAELVEKYLPNAVMSSVNIAEVAAVLSQIGMPEDIIINIMNDLSIEIISFDQEQALLTGFLRNKTKAAGLSLGDRACINLSSTKNLIVVTADKIWNTLDLTNNIVLIR
jgi:PIN domain nuclease of toxin-antitoxin system